MSVRVADGEDLLRIQPVVRRELAQPGALVDPGRHDLEILRVRLGDEGPLAVVAPQRVMEPVPLLGLGQQDELGTPRKRVKSGSMTYLAPVREA
jgi:hypothetical protein